MSEEFFDSKQYGQIIARSEALKRLLQNRKFITEQMDQAMTMCHGKATPLALIRALEYWLEDNQEVSEAIERLGLQTIKRRCLLHYYAIYVYAMAYELKVMEEFGRKSE